MMDQAVPVGRTSVLRLPSAVLGSIGCARANTPENAAEIVLMNFCSHGSPMSGSEPYDARTSKPYRIAKQGEVSGKWGMPPG